MFILEYQTIYKNPDGMISLVFSKVKGIFESDVAALGAITESGFTSFKFPKMETKFSSLNSGRKKLILFDNEKGTVAFYLTPTEINQWMGEDANE